MQGRACEAPTVESEGVLVDVVGKVLVADAVVQGAGELAFEQRSDEMNTG